MLHSGLIVLGFIYSSLSPDSKHRQKRNIFIAILDLKVKHFCFRSRMKRSLLTIQRKIPQFPSQEDVGQAKEKRQLL